MTAASTSGWSSNASSARTAASTSTSSAPADRSTAAPNPHHDLFEIERAVERHYRKRRISPRVRRHGALGHGRSRRRPSRAQRLLKQQLEQQRDELDTREENLIELAAGGTLAVEKVRAKIYQVQAERDRILEQLTHVDIDLTAGDRAINEQLELLVNAADLYMSADNEYRRRLNQLLYRAIYIESRPESDDIVEVALNDPPYDALFAGQDAFEALQARRDLDEIEQAYQRALTRYQTFETKEAVPADRLFHSQILAPYWTAALLAIFAGTVSNTVHLVDPGGGFEPPPTFSLRTRRATNCAMGPSRERLYHPSRGGGSDHFTRSGDDV